MIDDDRNEDDLIDRFAINVSSSIGQAIQMTMYSGLFGFANVSISFSVICKENFHGPNCDMPCLDNCTCEPGFTGEFCATSIDDCVGVECGLNQRCVDVHLNFSCECEPGYTGPNCTVNIDECLNARCNNGRCVDGVASFSCTCDFGYTGELCETLLRGYELQVIIVSFNHSVRGCADIQCQTSMHCESSLINKCDYYFSLCQRPAGTLVSYMPHHNQGNCSTVYVQVSDDNNSKINRSITFSGLLWVSNQQLGLMLLKIDYE